MLEKTLSDFRKVLEIIKERNCSPVEASIEIGKSRTFYYDIKSKLKLDNHPLYNECPKGKQGVPYKKFKVSRVYKKRTSPTPPSLVSINIPDKKPVTIMMGDSEEIMKILSLANKTMS